MDLLRSLRDELVDDKIPLSSILRKAKVLASILGNQELLKFVDSEINGYADKDELPDYRRVGVMSYASYVGPFGALLSDIQIPTNSFPEPLRVFASQHEFAESILALESHAKRSPETGLMKAPWPAEALKFLNTTGTNYVCIEAYKMFSVAALLQIFERVRTALLNIVLELLKTSPQGSISEEELGKISPEKVVSVVTNNIYGSHTIVASGVDFSQTVNNTDLRGNFEALEASLKSISLPEKNAIELLEAVKLEKPESGQKGLGVKVTNAITKVTDLILKGSVTGLTSASIGILVQAVSAYYGIR